MGSFCACTTTPRGKRICGHDMDRVCWQRHATAPSSLEAPHAFSEVRTPRRRMERERAVGTFTVSVSLGGMLDLLNEHARLALTDTQISEGERRIARQTACLEHFSRAGHDTRETERLLGELEGHLAAWQQHRAEILSTLERQDGSVLAHS